MIKCLLSFEASHHVIYLKGSGHEHWLSFDETRAHLTSHYSGLVESMNLDFGRDKFEIFDPDFERYVIVDRCTRIGNLAKLKVTKQNEGRAGLNTQLLAVNNCFNSCLNSCLNGCSNGCPNGYPSGYLTGYPSGHPNNGLTCGHQCEHSKLLSQDATMNDRQANQFDRINSSRDSELNSTKDTSKNASKDAGWDVKNELDQRKNSNGLSRGTPIQSVRNV